MQYDTSTIKAATGWHTTDQGLVSNASASAMDVESIQWQHDNIVQLAFNSSPDLSGLNVNDVLTVSNCSQSIFNGDFQIHAIDDTAETIDIIIPGVDKDAYDEDSGSVAAATGKSPALKEVRGFITKSDCDSSNYLTLTMMNGAEIDTINYKGGVDYPRAFKKAVVTGTVSFQVLY